MSLRRSGLDLVWSQTQTFLSEKARWRGGSRGEQDTRVLLSQSRCHLRLSGWVEGGGKKGKKGEGGRASADLEGLSGRGGSNVMWRRPALNQKWIVKQIEKENPR